MQVWDRESGFVDSFAYACNFSLVFLSTFHWEELYGISTIYLTQSY